MKTPALAALLIASLCACAPVASITRTRYLYNAPLNDVVSSIAQICPQVQPDVTYSFFSVEARTPTSVTCLSNPNTPASKPSSFRLVIAVSRANDLTELTFTQKLENSSEANPVPEAQNRILTRLDGIYRRVPFSF